MSQVAITVIMVVAALGVLRLLIAAINQARAAGDLDASTGLTLGIAWLISLPIAVVALSGGLRRPLDAFGHAIPVYPGWYPQATRAAILLAGVLAAVLLVRRLTSGSVSIHAAGLFAILLWAVALLASGLHGGPVLSFRGCVMLVGLMAATVLPRGRGACLGAGIYGVTLAIASSALTLFQYDAAFVIPRVKAFGLGFQGVKGSFRTRTCWASALLLRFPLLTSASVAARAIGSCSTWPEW